MAHWFIDGLPNLNMGGFSMAMLNNQGVPFVSMIQGGTICFHDPRIRCATEGLQWTRKTLTRQPPRCQHTIGNQGKTTNKNWPLGRVVPFPNQVYATKGALANALKEPEWLRGPKWVAGNGDIAEGFNGKTIYQWGLFHYHVWLPVDIHQIVGDLSIANVHHPVLWTSSQQMV